MRIRPALVAFFLLASCGGGGGGNPPAPQPVNQAPSFTSATTATVTENVTDAYLAVATDPDGDAVTFSISAGADAARFSIAPAGQLRFVPPPNFEAPADADGDNLYLVELTASDGRATARLAVQISVENDREGILVRRVASGLNRPLHVAPIPGDARVLVAQKGGNIILVDPATGSRTQFMSVVNRWDSIAGAVPNFSSGGERGLLGIAAAPNYQASGDFFVFLTVADGDIEVRRYRRGADGLGNFRTNETLLRIEHSQFDNHNGGWLGFGPDGKLYIATGDGGGSGDPQDNAQDRDSLLGKILRLMRNPDPFAGASPGRSWIADSGNPFFNGGGAPEVFALGLRNPFRASFHNGNLLIGDVGQNMVEEIDLLGPQDGGANFGWPFREGTRAFRGAAPAGLVDPVSEYFHGTGPREGRTVIGGHVYRGPAASLAGNYVFADFISGNIWTVPVARFQQGQVLPAGAYERRNGDFTPDVGTLDQIVSFGEDSAGNLYIVDFDGELFVVGST